MTYNDLNVGDTVNIWHKYTDLYYTGIVIRKSKTTITIEITLKDKPDAITFNLTNGRERGATFGYTGCSYITFDPVEKLKKHNEAKKAEKHRYHILNIIHTKINWNNVSNEDLDKIYNLIKPYME